MDGFRVLPYGGTRNDWLNIDADFTVRADFTAATDEAALLLLAFGPKTVTGAGDVTLELEGGRDTLTVDHGEMILKFLPDGKTVQVSTSNPAT